MPLALALGPATVPLGESVAVSQDTTLELELHIEVGGRAFDRTIDRAHRQRFVVAPREDGWEIRWRDNRHLVFEPGHQHDRQLVELGHTYAVAPGQDPGPVVSGQDLLGAMLRVRALFGDASEVGDVFPADPMFAGLLDDAPGTPELLSGTVTVSALDDAELVATVVLSLRADGERDGAQVTTTAELRGSLLLDVPTGRVRFFEVMGPVRVLAIRAGLRTTGEGRMVERLVVR